MSETAHPRIAIATQGGPLSVLIRSLMGHRLRAESDR
jgi:hypothetical protein